MTRYELKCKLFLYVAEYEAGGKRVFHENRIVGARSAAVALRQAVQGCAEAMNDYDKVNGALSSERLNAAVGFARENVVVRVRDFHEISAYSFGAKDEDGNDAGIIEVDGRRGNNYRRLRFLERDNPCGWHLYHGRCQFARGKREIWGIEDCEACQFLDFSQEKYESGEYDRAIGFDRKKAEEDFQKEMELTRGIR